MSPITDRPGHAYPDHHRNEPFMSNKRYAPTGTSNKRYAPTGSPKKSCTHREPECCNELGNELKFTKKMQKQHCPGQQKMCPFTPDGEPIGAN